MKFKLHCFYVYYANVVRPLLRIIYVKLASHMVLYFSPLQRVPCFPFSQQIKFHLNTFLDKPLAPVLKEIFMLLVNFILQMLVPKLQHSESVFLPTVSFFVHFHQQEH